MVELRAIGEYIAGRSPDAIAKLAAYWLAPGLVFGLVVAGASGRGLAVDLGRPVTVSELRTEITEQDGIHRRPGAAIVVEPVDAEYRIEVGARGARIWSSLDTAAARANSDRLRISGGALTTKTPFIGVPGPVTIVVDGELGRELQVPGGGDRVDDLLVASRRSVSIVSSVLLVCVFAFGTSLPSVLPIIRDEKHAAG